MVKNSIKSRIRVTKTGKLLRRRMGLGHFRAKKNSREMQRKERQTGFNIADKKVLVKMYGLTK